METTKKLVIGLVGKPLAGKGTCSAVMDDVAKENGLSVSHLRFSDPLRETLALWNELFEDRDGSKSEKLSFSEYSRETLDLWQWQESDAIDDTITLFREMTDDKRRLPLETTRENLQRLPQLMNKIFGKGTLTKIVRNRILSENAPIIIVDGVRWLEDEKMLRELSMRAGTHTMLVYIDAAARVRFERTKTRGENAGETELTFEMFQKQNWAENERFVPEIGRRADITIRNNGTEEEFTEKVKTSFRSLLKKFYLV